VSAGRRERPLLLAAGAVVALAAVLFAGEVFGGRVLYERDIHALFWGQCAAFARAVRGGAWPFWNPWLGFGQPLWANPGAQVLYPPTWLNVLVRPEDYYTLYAVGHLVLAGFGMLALGRALRLSWGAVVAGAALYMLSGPLLSSVNLWQHFAGAAWMPWVVAAAVRALDRPSAGPVVLWSLAQSLQALSGSADLVALTALPQAGVLVHRLIIGKGRRAERLLAAAAAAALAVGLTAAQWVPALDLLGSTVRAEQSDRSRLLWSIPTLLTAQTLVPVLPHELPLRQDLRRSLYDGREPLLASIYLGLPALALALAAFSAPRRRLAMGAAALLLLSLWVALGRHSLAYFWALAAFPPLALFRYPAKALLLGALAFALLSAQGVEAWRAGRLAGAAASRVAAATTAAAAAALVTAVWLRAEGPAFLAPSPEAPLDPAAAASVLAVLAWSSALGLAAALLAALSRRGAGSRWGAAAALLAALDLLAVHRGLNRDVPGALVRGTPEVVTVLRSDGAVRVHGFDYLLQPAGASRLLPHETAELVRLPTALRFVVLAQQYPLSFPRWGLRGSFDSDVVGLDSRKRRSLRLLANASERDPERLLRLLQVGAVTHVVARHSTGLESLAPLRVVRTPSAGDVHVFRVPGTLPRLFVATGVRAADGLEAYRALLDPAFDPRSTVLLPPAEARPGGAPAPWRIEVRDERADRLAATVTTDAPAFLVVADGYDRGWQATVDGRPAPVLRANVAFRGIALPAGAHDVSLRYRPPGLATGLGLSALSLAAVLVVLVRLRLAGPRS
jgi:hypothetical protein